MKTNKVILLSVTFLVILALLTSVVGCGCGTDLTVTTVKSDLVTTNSATLFGHLQTYGPIPPQGYTVYFEWGLTDNTMNHETPRETMSYTGDFIHVINNLTPDTTYSFRAMVVNHNGQPLDHDQVLHFTTESLESSEGEQEEEEEEPIGEQEEEEEEPKGEQEEEEEPETVTPIAEWHFDEGSGTNVLDSSGKGNHGTLMPLGSAPIWTTDSVSGGYALMFDGNDDYVLVSNSYSLNPSGSMTIEAWIKTTDTDGGAIVNKDDVKSDLWGRGEVESSNRQYGIALVADGILATSFWSPNRAYVNTGENENLPKYNDGRWHHVATTLNILDGQARLYVDGKLLGQSLDSLYPGTITSIQITNEPIWIGNRTYEYPLAFTGIIDEVIIWDVALTDEQIAQSANR